MWLLSRCATTASEITSRPIFSTTGCSEIRIVTDRALRIVVLARDVEDVRADDLGHIGQDLGQAVGIVLLVDVLDVAIALFRRHRVADVVDIEAERLGQVVEALKLQARQRLDHGGTSEVGAGWQGRELWIKLAAR